MGWGGFGDNPVSSCVGVGVGVVVVVVTIIPRTSESQSILEIKMKA